MVSDWGDDFLLRINSSPGYLFDALSKIIPADFFQQGSSLKDSLAWLYMNHPYVQPAMREKYIPELSVTKLTMVEVLEWILTIYPEVFSDNTRIDSEFYFNRVTTTTQWQLNLRIQSAIGKGSVSELLAIMKGGETIPKMSRMNVYCFFLGPSGDIIDEERNSVTTINPTFLSLFSLSFGLCSRNTQVEILARKFLNRIILFSNWSNILRSFLALIDSPLIEYLQRVAGVDVLEKKFPLIESVFACTTLPESQLTWFWDILLISPPDLLVKVTAFAMVDVREFLLNCRTRDEIDDVLLSVGELVEDFEGIVKLGIQSNEIVID